MKSLAVFALLGLLALADCSAQTQQTVSAQALADAQGLITTTQALEQALTQYDPNALPPATQAQIASLETAIVAGIQSLSTATPAAAGAARLQQIDADINTVLTAIGAALPAASVAFPALAPFIPMYDAAVALLPVIEAYVNTVAAQPATASATMAPHWIAHSYTVDQARLLLGVKK